VISSETVYDKRIVTNKHRYIVGVAFRTRKYKSPAVPPERRKRHNVISGSLYIYDYSEWLNGQVSMQQTRHQLNIRPTCVGTQAPNDYILRRFLYPPQQQSQHFQKSVYLHAAICHGKEGEKWASRNRLRWQPFIMLTYNKRNWQTK